MTKNAKMNRFTVLESQKRLSTTTDWKVQATSEGFPIIQNQCKINGQIDFHIIIAHALIPSKT